MPNHKLLNQKTMSALNILQVLNSEDAVTANEVMTRLMLAPAFTYSVLNSLRAHGYIKAKRGVSGGYVRTELVSTHTTADFLNAFNGRFAQRGRLPNSFASERLMVKLEDCLAMTTLEELTQ